MLTSRHHRLQRQPADTSPAPTHPSTQPSGNRCRARRCLAPVRGLSLLNDRPSVERTQRTQNTRNYKM
uniref:Uncharacterized protein n=1 Tax=Anguilla anguilla TaxID=7936 RepID=A0A0E9V0N6_ANGAN